MSDTPRTDAAYFKPLATMYDMAGEMKRMERELNAANERIKRLEEAGGKMAEVLIWSAAIKYKQSPTVQAWRKAKEAKP